MTIHVVGNACIDLTLNVDCLPRPGETRVAAGVLEGLGGKGLNQAVAAARTGAAVRLSAAVGRDEAAQRIRAAIVAEGLDDTGLTVMDQPTDRSIILVERGGENMIVSATACAARFDPLSGALSKKAPAAGDTVVLQGNLQGPTTAAVLVQARAWGAFTVLNPSPLAAALPIPWASVDLVIVNAVEAATLTGSGDPKAASRVFRDWGAGAVVVTLGAAGAMLTDRTGTEAFAAAPINAVDTAGAGDVFCGVLAGLIQETWTVHAATAVANEAAAIAVTRHGALASCPTREEIAELVSFASPRSSPPHRSPA
ncbi:MAG: PfkB family carbohydrate kinase [Inquilinaceae bacterium]